jgi:hypothetical protein
VFVNQKVEEALRKVVQLSAKTVVDYRSESRAIRFKSDDENIDALAEAICELSDLETALIKPPLEVVK